MFSQDEENFLKSVPEDKIVEIRPFSIRATEIANEIIASVKEVAPSLKVIHMGASALGISGQKDLDIYALADEDSFDVYLPKLVEIFGKPESIKKDSVAWKMTKQNYEIEFYLTDPTSAAMKKQIGVFEILKNSPRLLKEYEKLKDGMNGKSYKEYQRKKYEFYHKILGNGL